jgi:hypothetical protein
VVVETCDVPACGIVLLRPCPGTDAGFEYEDIRYAMMGDIDARAAREGLGGVYCPSIGWAVVAMLDGGSVVGLSLAEKRV